MTQLSVLDSEQAERRVLLREFMVVYAVSGFQYTIISGK